MTQSNDLIDILEEASCWPPAPLYVRVNYHDSPYELKMTDKGDWCDLYVAETVKLKMGDFKYISMGISMELPKGYEAIMAPRSSTFKRWGIIQTNSIGK